jgi:PIN domain nuclease of toxin-antitoxin system
MFAGIADTHAALWYLLSNPNLSRTARTFMDECASAGNAIGLSPVSLAEIVYLVEKNRLPRAAYDELKSAIADVNYVIEEAPFNARVVEAMQRVAREAVPDLPDRIVAATALYFDVPVISRDGRIRASNVRTVW